MISIVIPCYNAEATLEQTLRSVLAQDVDKEIVVVDDGSLDRSADISRNFGHAVRCISTPNRGASAARNLGMSAASGAYIMFLDSDDLLSLGTLAERLRLLERTSADVAFTNWDQIDEAGRGVADSQKELLLPDTQEELEVAIATARFWGPPGAFLYRRGLLERLVGWNTDLAIVQDVRFLFDAARSGAVFSHLAQVGVSYRVRAGSLSHQSNGAMIADCARFARQLEGIWCTPGAPTARQAEALAEMWARVATASLVSGLPEFEEAVAAHNRFAHPNARFQLGRILRRVLDADKSAALAARYLSLKAWIRRRRAA
jgi:glycosyltransferase involved in cell wall biosynthesis